MNQPNYAARRRKAFAAAAKEARVRGFLVTRPEDVRYLTGFSGEDSFVLVAGAKAVLITDGRFAEQAAKECPGVESCIRRGPMSAAVAAVAKSHRAGRLGVQEGHMTLAGRRGLEKALGGRAVHPVGEVVGALRLTKDEHEIACIRKAVRAAQKAFAGMLELGARGWIGRTERDLAAELDYRMRRAGADGAAFDTIVAEGPHGSLPHYRPGNTKIRGGSSVLIDWGAKVNGYCSDLTRVVFAGTIPPELAEVYQVVLAAQRAGIAACRGQVAAASVDRKARMVIESAGYGERFVHSLGHGLGLEIHESPALSSMSKARLRPGMVVTVEPGIYLPGVGGVRIEDDVWITPRGCQRLTSLPRDLSAMVLR